MAVKRKVRPSLALFPLTIEQALKICQRIPPGVKLVREHQHTRGVKYGPYWFARWTDEGGVRRKLYVGPDEKKHELEAAWRIAEPRLRAERARALAELAELEASPEVQRARELEQRLGGLRKASSELASIPILAFRPK